jgi:hypothetical protein
MPWQIASFMFDDSGKQLNIQFRAGVIRCYRPLFSDREVLYRGPAYAGVETESLARS